VHPQQQSRTHTRGRRRQGEEEEDEGTGTDRDNHSQEEEEEEDDDEGDEDDLEPTEELTTEGEEEDEETADDPEESDDEFPLEYDPIQGEGFDYHQPAMLYPLAGITDNVETMREDPHRYRKLSAVSKLDRYRGHCSSWIWRNKFAILCCLTLVVVFSLGISLNIDLSPGDTYLVTHVFGVYTCNSFSTVTTCDCTDTARMMGQGMELTVPPQKNFTFSDPDWPSGTPLLKVSTNQDITFISYYESVWTVSTNSWISYPSMHNLTDYTSDHYFVFLRQLNFTESFAFCHHRNVDE